MTATEVWLYGSVARGDQDRSSDVDLLIAGDGHVNLTAIEAKYRGPLSVSRYRWEELQQMAAYGSLFLHHIKSEGKPIMEGDDHRLRAILDGLGEYRRADLELQSFLQVLDDVEASTRVDHSVAFELGVVATAARHSAILGCYLLGMPDFGRDSAFETLLPHLGHPSSAVAEFIWLYKFRRADDEQIAPPSEPSTEDLLVWVDRVRSLIGEVNGLERN
jgi:predicted nucleotidyltransferase